MGASSRYAWIVKKEFEQSEARRQARIQQQEHEALERRINTMTSAFSVYHHMVVAPFMMSAFREDD